MKIKYAKLIIIFITIAIIVVLISMFLLPRTGLFLYSKPIVVLSFKNNHDSFDAVKNYMVANRGSLIFAMDPAHRGQNDVPKEATFRIKIAEGNFYTSEDTDLDVHIAKVLKTLTFESVYYTEDCVIFSLSSPLSARSQGVLFTTTGKPAAFLSGILTTTEIGDGWFYYEEAPIGEYPG